MATLDLPTMLATTVALQAQIAEILNGLANAECSDEQPDGKTMLHGLIGVYKQWQAAGNALRTSIQTFIDLGYPILPVVDVRMKMKNRLQAELRATDVALGLVHGFTPAVSGTLAFQARITKMPQPEPT